jgi:hypothetical protein
MPRHVGSPVQQLQRAQRRAPAHSLDLQFPERLTRFPEEGMVVSDQPCGFEPGAQRELPHEHRPRPAAQRNPAILSGLGLVPIDLRHACFVDTHNAVHQ